MNNQRKKAEKPEKNPAPPPAVEPVANGPQIKPKRGRPRISPHDSATQNRLRVQRYRDAKREGEEVQVEIFLPKAWHDWLLNVKDANLREVGVEAFALWLKKQGFPGLVSNRKKASDAA